MVVRPMEGKAIFWVKFRHFGTSIVALWLNVILCFQLEMTLMRKVKATLPSNTSRNDDWSRWLADWECEIHHFNYFFFTSKRFSVTTFSTCSFYLPLTLTSFIFLWLHFNLLFIHLSYNFLAFYKFKNIKICQHSITITIATVITTIKKITTTMLQKNQFTITSL